MFSFLQKCAIRRPFPNRPSQHFSCVKFRKNRKVIERKKNGVELGTNGSMTSNGNSHSMTIGIRAQKKIWHTTGAPLSITTWSIRFLCNKRKSTRKLTARLAVVRGSRSIHIFSYSLARTQNIEKNGNYFMEFTIFVIVHFEYSALPLWMHV